MAKQDEFVSDSIAYGGGVAANRRLAEEALLARVLAGESAAKEEIFTLYFDKLYSFVFGSVGRDKALAEDITQETFLAAVKSIDSFDGNSGLYTWISGIARHKIADHYRRSKKEHDREVIRLGDNDPGTVDEGALASDGVESIETRVAVTRAMSELDPDYRQVLMLKYVEEMSVAEICHVMKRSQKSIEGLLTRARARLKETLAEHREG